MTEWTRIPMEITNETDRRTMAAILTSVGLEVRIVKVKAAHTANTSNTASRHKERPSHHRRAVSHLYGFFALVVQMMSHRSALFLTPLRAFFASSFVTLPFPFRSAPRFI